MHKNELADAAGVSRDTLAAIESGQGFRRASLTKIERALDAAEEEAGITAPPPMRQEPQDAAGRVVVIRLPTPGGGQIVVEGPVGDLDALEAAARRLLRGFTSE